PLCQSLHWASVTPLSANPPLASIVSPSTLANPPMGALLQCPPPSPQSLHWPPLIPPLLHRCTPPLANPIHSVSSTPLCQSLTGSP
ncbi:unnamed protein product, partial [Staurois parvus]